VFIVASLVLLALGVLAYRRQLGPGGSTELFILRLIVLLLLAAIVAGTVVRRKWYVQPRRVAMLVDESQSMSLFGLDTAAQIIAERFPLPAGVSRDRWIFADTAGRTADWMEPAVDSARTRLGRALELVGRTRPGAVVVLSDGQDNGEAMPVPVASRLGMPLYAVGLGRAGRRNAALTRVDAPVVVYAGDTMDIAVRVTSSGFNGERARVRLGAETREVVLSQDGIEQELLFRTVFASPGRKAVRATIDSLPGEDDLADNRRVVIVSVRPQRLIVAYVTNSPGPSSRFLTAVLEKDARFDMTPVVADVGGLAQAAAELEDVNAFVVDGPVERPEDVGFWQSVAARVRAGAGILLLAGPNFAPGPAIGSLVTVESQRSQPNGFVPEPTSVGRILPWFSTGIDLAQVPPFTGIRPARIDTTHTAVWLADRETHTALLTSARVNRGKLVYLAGYPLWRWGFMADEQTDDDTPLSLLLGGIVRFLAESDTERLRLEPDKPGFLQGEPVRLTLRAVAPDGQPWTGLSATLVVTGSDTSSAARESVAVPMVERAGGSYEAAVDGLTPGGYLAQTRVKFADSAVGRAGASFAVAEQSVELARTGLNQGLLRALAEASHGRYFSSDSLPAEGFEMTLGQYERHFVFDPRRTAAAYLLVALLAGLELFLRRRRGLL